MNDMNELETKLKELFVLTKDMRFAQKMYFATREKSWMRESIRLEKDVDRIIAQIELLTTPDDTPQP